MRIARYHSHLNGYEFIKFHRPYLWREICRIIKNVDTEACKVEISSEARARSAVSTVALRRSMRREFFSHKWAERFTGCWLTEAAPATPKPTARAPKLKVDMQLADKCQQTDFVKDRVAVEAQFGKYPVTPYGLFAQHMADYVGDAIDVGIEVLAMKALEDEMSSGAGNYEDELNNLIREGRGVPGVPLVLIGVAP